MSEIEPHKRPKKAVATRHIPQLVIPVPLAQAQEFVRDAVKGTTLTEPVGHVMAGYFLFQPHLRYSVVDDTHTRIEIDLTDNIRGASVLGFQQRRGEIDRFFVAIEDELDRRHRWGGRLPGDDAPAVEGGN